MRRDRVGSVFELGLAGLLAETGLGKMREQRLPAALRRCGGGGGVEAIEDEQVALGVVEGRESSDSLEMVDGGEGVHFVVLDLVPGDVPAGTVGLAAYREFHGAEVVADGGQASHERKLRAADGENERVVGGV